MGCEVPARARNRQLSGIFVSYRRSDSQGEAGRLFDDLVKHFGEATVFMDVSAIEAGRDFRKAIEEGVTKCGVLLVVIGLEWLDAKDERGSRRLDDPSDFVRIETASALKRDIPVIPVLVRGAKMPTADRLPDELKELAYRNCIELTHPRWRSDVQLLTDALRRVLGDASQQSIETRPHNAATSARPTIAQKEPPGVSKSGQVSAVAIDSADVERVTRALAFYIGPIAGIVVKRAIPQCSSIEDLYLKVAQEIDSRREREKFLQGHASIPRTSAPEAGHEIAPVIRASKSPGSTGSPATISKSDEVETEAARPATEKPSEHRRKNRILAVAGGAFLIILFVVLARFAPWTRSGGPQIAQISNDKTGFAEAAAPVSSTPALPAEKPLAHDAGVSSLDVATSDKAKTNPSRRVRLPMEVSQKLLIKPIAPDYPVLARQAHIQGAVVLDANISKYGTVESLRVISGDPLLIQAALNAVKQWRYKPYLLNGEPVDVNTKITVGFTLSGG